MTAASKGTGASSIGLADDLGSNGNVWMPLVVPSHPRSAWSPFFGEVFWGFISSPCLLISYLLTEIVSSSRNQLSQIALAYATASLLPPCPRSPFSFFLSCDFREQTMAACAAGIPFVSWAETTRDFRSRTGLFRPHQELPHHHLYSLKIEPGKFDGIKYLHFSRTHVQILC